MFQRSLNVLQATCNPFTGGGAEKGGEGGEEQGEEGAEDEKVERAENESTVAITPSV